MLRGYIDFGVKEQNPCATRLENIPFTWWRGEVKVAAGPRQLSTVIHDE